MAEERVQRRLAAILAADVVGYSGLMEADEEGTRARLRTLQSELIDPKIRQDGGRIVKTTGDGILVEFPSAVDAVRNALAIQEAVAVRNSVLPDDQRMEFRVGINIGDVMVEGGDLHGDGVNVAARLEEACEPGAVFVSGSVFDQVAGKLDARFDDLGERTVKNLARPVRIFRARIKSEAAADPTTAREALPLPEKPSIAVLPFDNMSGDEEQEYFSDGITEDIITELSRYPDFLVIARNSTFAYKGKALDIKRIGSELGVQYVLEGSVRRAGSRVRVTAQLIDAQTGNHLWAERYDRELNDIFAVQDEITRIIAGTLGPRLSSIDTARIMRKDPDSLDAYDLVLRASAQWWRFERDSHSEARRLAEMALAKDPRYARAHAVLALNYMQERNSGYADDPEEWLRRGYEAARRSISLDEGDAVAHLALGVLSMFARRHEQAISELQRALELNPNLADAHAQLGNALTFAGRVEEALAELDIAIRLNPHHPPWYLMILGRTYFSCERCEDAIGPLRRAVNAIPEFTPARVALAACQSVLGNLEEARDEVAGIIADNPEFTLAFVREVVPFKDLGTLERFIAALRMAGLPE